MKFINLWPLFKFRMKTELHWWISASQISRNSKFVLQCSHILRCEFSGIWISCSATNLWLMNRFNGARYILFNFLASINFNLMMKFIKKYALSAPKKNMLPLRNKGGRDSSVGIATRYGQDGPGIESRWGRDFPLPSRPALGPTQPPVQWVPGLSRG